MLLPTGPPVNPAIRVYARESFEVGFSLENPGRITFGYEAGGLAYGFFNLGDLVNTDTGWGNDEEGNHVSIPLAFNSDGLNVYARDVNFQSGSYRFILQNFTPPTVPDPWFGYVNMQVPNSPPAGFALLDLHGVIGGFITNITLAAGDNLIALWRQYIIDHVRSGGAFENLQSFQERLLALPMEGQLVTVEYRDNSDDDWEAFLPRIPSRVPVPFWCEVGSDVGDFAGVAISSEDILESVASRSLTLTARYDSRLEDFDTRIEFGMDGLGRPLRWAINTVSRNGDDLELSLVTYAQ